jgi:hypothetical protein
MNITQKLANLVFPSPRSNGNSSDAPRTSLPPNEANNNRCEFAFSDGRRCRNHRAQLCAHHASKTPIRSGSASRANNVSEGTLLGLTNPCNLPELEPLCADLTTATNINRALAQVFLLMAQGRIPQKQAVAFGYLSQLLLQTVPGIRSEYVSVHGYKSWEKRLRSSLTETSAEAPDSSPGDEGGGEGQEEQASEANAQPMNEVVERQKDVAITSLLAHEKVEPEKCVSPRQSHGDQELSRVNKDTPLFGQEKVELEEAEYYADIYHRSLDLLDRKYDTTPEGRREAKALLLELELMNPAPAKPRRDFFGQTVDLVRRLHERESEISEPATPASQSPSAPRIPTAPAPLKASLAETSAVAAPPAMPEPAFCSSVLGDDQPSLRPLSPAAQPAADATLPRHDKKHAVPSPTNPSSTAHSTGWYAPPSWSAPRPDPFPGRQEKLKRKLRTMNDRRQQHQNQSRAFWR